MEGMDASAAIAHFRSPPTLWSRDDLVNVRPNPIPAVPGLYGWYFDELPRSDIAPVGMAVDQWQLLYVGIAPGRMTSTSNLRKRLRNHLSGNARGSTLRLTLGALLAEKLQLTPAPASGKFHWGEGEARLSAWLAGHARVTWFEHPAPWLIEADVVRELVVPLNRSHNSAHPFSVIVGQLRASFRIPAAR